MSILAPAELSVLTTGAGLVDRSERGKLALTGSEAAGLLTGQVSNDIEALAPGAGCYATLLTNKGKMLGDLRVLRTEDELHLDCERVALQALFDRLRVAAIGWQAELHKRTLQEGLLSLVGLAAAEVAGAGALGQEEHAHVAATLGGVAVRLVRADAGVDVLCAAEDTDAVRAALLEAGAVGVPAEAAEVVRVAAGRPRFGVDLPEDAVIPQEAGLNERAVSFTKGCYVGQETVARLHWRGKPNRQLRGLRLPSPVAEGTELVLEEKVVGRATSVVEHPQLGTIALALLRTAAEPGTTVQAGEVAAEVVALPFAAG